MLEPLTVVPASMQREGAGFVVNRAFPNLSLAMLDPFLLLDQMGPEDVGPREAKGAPDHPHRGFETVTYMLEGRLEHHDSQGHHGVLGPGDVQWMTAGAGVIHSEMPEARFFDAGGRMHGVQLWVNLPRKDKMTRPRYQDIPADRIPEVELPDGGGKVRVVAGHFGGVEAVIDTRTPIAYLHAALAPGGSFEHGVPAGHRGFAYVLRGDADVAGTLVPERHLVTLGKDGVHVQGGANGADVLVISGVPLGEPVARYGPFVMNTREEIVQAMRDFQEGRFGTIPATMEHGERRPYLPGKEQAPGHE